MNNSPTPDSLSFAKSIDYWVERQIKRVGSNLLAAASYALALGAVCYWLFSRWSFFWSGTGAKVIAVVAWIFGAAAAFLTLLALIERRYVQQKTGFTALALAGALLTIASRLFNPTPQVTGRQLASIEALLTDTLHPNPNFSKQDVRIAKGIELSGADPVKIAEGKIVVGDLAKAVDLLDGASKDLGVELADARFYEARALWALGTQTGNPQYDRVLNEANLSLQMRSGFSPALSLKCIALRHLHRFDDALIVCADAVRADPRDAGARNAEAAALVAKGDQEFPKGTHYYEEALADLDIAVQNHGDIPQLWNNRAIALRMLQRYPEALASAERALRIAPKFDDALLTKATVLKNMHNYAAAAAIYRELTVINPNDPEAWNNLGSLEEKMGREHWPEALIAYDAALHIDPGFAIALFNKGEVLNELDRPDEAIPLLQQACQAMPDDPESRYELAYSLYRTGKKAESLARIKEALQLDSHYDRAKLLREEIVDGKKPTLDTR